METFRLTRTGREPIEFTGEAIADSSSKSHNGPRQNRWHEVRVYRTKGGNLILEVVRRTCWQGESDLCQATKHSDSAGVAEELRAINPTDGVQGYPEGQQWYAKQAALMRSIAEGWSEIVSTILEEIGFVEKID